MMLGRYRNELIVAAAIVFALGGYLYKKSILTHIEQTVQQEREEVAQIEEAASLKTLWGDKKIAKRIEVLHTIVPEDKIKWSKKGKKLTATYSNLKPSELNKVMAKLLNLPLQLTYFKLHKEGQTYQLEVKCKW